MTGRKVSDPVNRELLDAMREIIRRAVMTLAAVRDPDRRYQGWSKVSVGIVRDVQDAYGYSSASVRNFAPTAYEITQMEIVLPWLAWLRREEGEKAVRRILGWSMGAALWRLGQREGCSERTIDNRIDRSVAFIVKRFAGANLPVEYVEEPYKGATYALAFERPQGPHGDEEPKILKVYIGGQGFMKGGKKLRTAGEDYRLERFTP